jgi:hypothetical protein
MPIGDRPIMEIVIDQLSSAGFTDIVLCAAGGARRFDVEGVAFTGEVLHARASRDGTLRRWLAVGATSFAWHGTTRLAGENAVDWMAMTEEPRPAAITTGAAAAHAAAIAVATLERHAHEPVTALVERCHERLRATRGVVMSLGALSAREHTLTWLGVGNVDGVLLRAEPAAQPALEWVPLRGGVVGDRLAPPHASTIPITRGDTLVFATDGFDDFVQSLTTDDAAQRVADRLLARHARGTDDALVLVARYLGPAR